MHFIEGINRHQMQFLSLDDMIDSDNPVRIIDEFVDKVDLQTIGVASASCNSEGRPPFHPSLLLKLYLYGYLNRVRVKEVFSQSDGERLAEVADDCVPAVWLTYFR